MIEKIGIGLRDVVDGIRVRLTRRPKPAPAPDVFARIDARNAAEKAAREAEQSGSEIKPPEARQ